MALLQIPGQFLAQPRFATNLDQSHWLFKNIVLAWSAGRGLNDGAHGMGSSVGVDTYADFPRGHYYVPGDDFSYLQFADNTDYNVLGGAVSGIHRSSVGASQIVWNWFEIMLISVADRTRFATMTS